MTNLLLTLTLTMPPNLPENMARAIYIAEGGKKAKVPYGILSVKVKDEADARRVCLVSITNNWRRWQAPGKTNDFVDFMANRWVPVKSDPAGNKNWKRNVKAILGDAAYLRR